MNLRVEVTSSRVQSVADLQPRRRFDWSQKKVTVSKFLDLCEERQCARRAHLSARRSGEVVIWQIAIGAALITLASEPVSAADTTPPAGIRPYQWTGFYAGGHLGDAWGRSDWSAQGPAATPLNGSLGFNLPYDMFKGTGSYFLGLQVGYNYQWPTGLVLGAVADMSFPNTIAGTQTFASPSTGQASYGETVEYSGTVRARIGYALDDWLVYATGGLAWTEDQFQFTFGGAATPGATDSSLHARVGWVAGGGVEFPVAPNWTANLEYLFTDFSPMTVVFPVGAQRFNSDLNCRTFGWA